MNIEKELRSSNLLLSGPTGTGKTRAVIDILRRLDSLGYSQAYVLDRQGEGILTDDYIGISSMIHFNSSYYVIDDVRKRLFDRIRGIENTDSKILFVVDYGIAYLNMSEEYLGYLQYISMKGRAKLIDLIIVSHLDDNEDLPPILNKSRFHRIEFSLGIKAPNSEVASKASNRVVFVNFEKSDNSTYKE